MKYFFKIGLNCLLLLLLNSCSNKCVVGDITVSELLGISANQKSIDYCRLLKSALTGDESAVKKLSLLEFENVVGYDHGAVIVDLIHQIGEEKYLKSISKVRQKEKIIINSYLEVGLMYRGNLVTETQSLKDEFPIIHIFLKQ